MAVQDPTVNNSWNLPDVGGDTGSWGGLLRTIIGDDSTGIDAVMEAISVVANAALSRAGGSMTGEIDILTERYVDNNFGGSTSGTLTMDLDAANFFYVSVTGTVTFAFSNVPGSGDAVFLMLEITNGGAQTITWDSSIKWPGSTEPTLTTSGVDLVTMYTRDGGTTWRAALAQSDSS